MGYFLCNKCKKFFTTQYREMPDEGCPFCKDKQHIRSIQRSMYLEWLKAESDGKTWEEYNEWKHHNSMYEDAMQYYDNVESKHVLWRGCKRCIPH